MRQFEGLAFCHLNLILIPYKETLLLSLLYWDSISLPLGNQNRPTPYIVTCLSVVLRRGDGSLHSVYLWDDLLGLGCGVMSARESVRSDWLKYNEAFCIPLRPIKYLEQILWLIDLMWRPDAKWSNQTFQKALMTVLNVCQPMIDRLKLRRKHVMLLPSDMFMYIHIQQLVSYLHHYIPCHIEVMKLWHFEYQM